MVRKELKKINIRIAISAITLVTTISMATSSFAAALTDESCETETVVSEAYEENCEEEVEQVQPEEPQTYAEQQLTCGGGVYLEEAESEIEQNLDPEKEIIGSENSIGEQEIDGMSETDGSEKSTEEISTDESKEIAAEENITGETEPEAEATEETTEESTEDSEESTEELTEEPTEETTEEATEEATEDKTEEIQLGWNFTDDTRYYINENGEFQTGWAYIDGDWYYFNEAGAMQCGGWIYADNDWYYLDTDGTMWYGGWKDINNKKYYLSNGGRMRTGWQYIDDKWYFLNSSGAMQTGWLYRGTENDREIWYYLHSSGSMKQGLQYINDKWYYFESSGRWVSNWEFLKNTGSMVQTSAEFVETLIKIARGDYGNTNYGDKYHVNGGGRSIGAWNSEIEAFMFDCSGVLKSVLWGWNGNKSGIYGGAVYCSNKVPDINDQGFHDVSEMHDITDINEIPTGALLWKQGHVGCYIGNGETIECTVQGDGTVQFGTVTSDGTRTVSNNVVEKWTQWGKIPYINYEISTYVS